MPRRQSAINTDAEFDGELTISVTQIQIQPLILLELGLHLFLIPLYAKNSRVRTFAAKALGDIALEF